MTELTIYCPSVSDLEFRALNHILSSGVFDSTWALNLTETLGPRAVLSKNLLFLKRLYESGLESP